MPLHKTNRGSRLDPTMISAPLGDFRHTMHIGRGGDVFGDTSFLSNHGPSSPSTNSVASPLPCISPEPVLNSEATSKDTPQPCELQHSESVSSLSLDLDFDLGPSILGDVLGVMDGLALDSAWTTAGVGEDYSSSKSVVKVEELGRSGKESFLSVKNDSNVQDVSMLKKNADWEISDESSLKSKAGGFRPKVRFSDKREEIIGQEDEIEELEQDTNELECVIPSVGERKKGNCTVSYPLRGQDRVGEATNHVADSQPSPASSHSSEFESLTPLDRRREDNHLTESESEEEGEGDEQGYTFEDEFDDEIGL